MKKTFYIYLLLTILGFNTYASEILREETREIGSHNGILGNYRFVTKIIHNTEKIEEFKSQFNFPTVRSEELVMASPPYQDPDYDIFGMGEKRIVQNKNKVLYTDGIVDCIGISVWDPLTKTASLYHASKMELGEDTQWMFKEYFIDRLKEKIQDLSYTEINIVSIYWSQDVIAKAL